MGLDWRKVLQVLLFVFFKVLCPYFQKTRRLGVLGRLKGGGKGGKWHGLEREEKSNKGLAEEGG